MTGVDTEACEPGLDRGGLEYEAEDMMPSSGDLSAALLFLHGESMRRVQFHSSEEDRHL